jgi:hypothetical protein
MGLLNPIWLWGIAGLVVPVTIHLLSRKDMRVIRLGSLRHLQDSITRQAVRIQLNAYALLALRCLIIILISLLLAGLFLNVSNKQSKWLAVESGLETQAEWHSIIDSLKGEGYEVRALQPGFPLLKSVVNIQSIPDYWKLTEELARVHPDRCVVISRSQVSGFAGHRPDGIPGVTWLTSNADSTRFLLISKRLPGDSVMARVGHSHGDGTSYETLALSAAQADGTLRGLSQAGDTSADSRAQAATSGNNDPTVTFSKTMNPIRIVLSGNGIDDGERRVVEASLAAIQRNSIVPVQFHQLPPSGDLHGDWLIWMSTDTPPVSDIPNIIRKDNSHGYVEMTGSRLLIPSAGSLSPVTGTSGSNSSVPTSKDRRAYLNDWLIVAPLTPATAVEKGFTLQLATLLLGEANQMLSGAASRHDRRIMPDQALFATHTGTTSIEAGVVDTHRSLGDVLAVVIVLLLASERWLANRQQL